MGRKGSLCQGCGRAKLKIDVAGHDPIIEKTEMGNRNQTPILPKSSIFPKRRQGLLNQSRQLTLLPLLPKRVFRLTACMAEVLNGKSLFFHGHPKRETVIPALPSSGLEPHRSCCYGLTKDEPVTALFRNQAMGQRSSRRQRRAAEVMQETRQTVAARWIGASADGQKHPA